MISPDARFERAPGVVARKVAGELVLVPVLPDVRTEAAGHPGIFVLNETAESLWEELARPRSPAELARHLTKHFDVSEERARQDVDHVLRDMQGRGVVRSTGSASATHPEAE